MLGKAKEVGNNDRLVLILTYNPSFKNFQNLLNKARILLTPNKEHGWRKLKTDKYNRASCCRSRFQICPFIEETKNFQNKDKSKTFDIRKGILNCRTNVDQLISCRSCSK